MLLCCAAGHSTVDLQVILLLTCRSSYSLPALLQVVLLLTCRSFYLVQRGDMHQAHHRLQSPLLTSGSGTLQCGHTVWTLQCGSYNVDPTVWILQCGPYGVGPTVWTYTDTVWTLQCGHTLYSVDPTVWTDSVAYLGQCHSTCCNPDHKHPDAILHVATQTTNMKHSDAILHAATQTTSILMPFCMQQPRPQAS